MQPGALRGHAGGVDEEQQVPPWWCDRRGGRQLQTHLIVRNDLVRDVDQPLLGVGGMSGGTGADEAGRRHAGGVRRLGGEHHGRAPAKR